MQLYTFKVVIDGQAIHTVLLRCVDDVGAIATAKFKATQLAIEKPDAQTRELIVVNPAGHQVFRTPVVAASGFKAHEGGNGTS